MAEKGDHVKMPELSEEERSRLTREALADVDAGRVIDHQSVQAWADSLSADTPLPVPSPTCSN